MLFWGIIIKTIGEIRGMKKFLSCVLICLFVPLFFACAESKTTLDAPTELSVSDGIISFVRVSGAEYYTLYINNDTVYIFDRATTENGKVTLVDKAGVAYLEYDARGYFELGESYTIKLKAHATDKNSSEFSSSVTYTHTTQLGVPNMILISNNILSWDLVENASQYNIKVDAPHGSSAYTSQDNSFDISFLLTEAGRYDFYIQSVSTNELYSNSVFSNKLTYIYQVKLSEPKIGEVKMVGGELYLACVIDDNANAITIKANDVTLSRELNAQANWCEKENNLLSIHLNEYFKNVLDFGEMPQYNFSVKSSYITHNEADRFYLDSEFSKTASFENKQHRLSSPNISLVENENEYVVNLSTSESDYLGFNLYVATGGVINTVFVSRESATYILNKNFTSIGAAVVGAGKMASSIKFVDIATEPISDELTLSREGNILRWNAISDAKYIVELDDVVLITSNNSVEINGAEKIVVSAVLENYKVKSVSLQTSKTKLELDESESELTARFTIRGNENAFGYYVYLEESGQARQKINHLFTSNTIDLSAYLEGNKTYTVFVQAVAEKFGDYDDSEIVRLGTISKSE